MSEAVEVIRVGEGRTIEKEYDVLTTIVCEITKKYRMNCSLDSIVRGFPKTVGEIKNVFSVEGDIRVVSGGDKKIWIKPDPQTNCRLIIYERLTKEEPGGKDVRVICRRRIICRLFHLLKLKN